MSAPGSARLSMRVDMCCPQPHACMRVCIGSTDTISQHASNAAIFYPPFHLSFYTICTSCSSPSFNHRKPASPPPCRRSSTPIFFILFPGYSPSKEIEAFARSQGRTPEAGNLTLISMGQGQEGPAEAVLDRLGSGRAAT